MAAGEGQISSGSGLASQGGVWPWILALLGVSTIKAYFDGSGGFLNQHDPQLFAEAGRVLLSPRYLDAFHDPLVQTGPLQLAFTGGAHLISSWLQLEVEVVLSITTQVLVAGGVAWVVNKSLTESASVRAAALLGVGFLQLASGAPWFAFISGQTAEALIAVFWMTGALWSVAYGRNPLLAGGAIGFAAAFKPTGILGLPILLLLPGVRRQGIGALMAIVLGLGAYLPFLLWGDFNMATFTWPLDLSGPFSWFSDAVSLTWGGRVAHGAVVVSAGAAASVLSRHSSRAVWSVPLTVAAVKVAADPAIVWYWYWIPVQLCLGVGIATSLARAVSPRGDRLRELALAALLVGLVFAAPSRSWGLVAAIVGLTVPLADSTGPLRHLRPKPRRT